MEIKGLTYKQFALIREAIIEKREKLWYDNIAKPFRNVLKGMSFVEVREEKRKFETTINQLRDEGICNKMLLILDKIEEDTQEELMIKKVTDDAEK